MTGFNRTALERWRKAPIEFISDVLCDPESKKPFTLLPAEHVFLQHAFKLDQDGRLLYPEQVYSCPKKSGKTTFAAIVTLALILLRGGAYPEATICANDYEQSVGRVFTMIKRIVESSPTLHAIAEITKDKITFPELDATITAIPSDFAGAAGGNQNIAVFDEVWGVVSERAHRLWDEMIPPPTRKIGCRLTTTYAGFSGESNLLEDLYKRGLAQPQIGTDLHAGDGILMFWTHSPIAPWQTDAWIAEMRRSLRTNQFLRMIENRFVSSESSFIAMEKWAACVDPDATPMISAPDLPVYVGIDASVKHDSTAVVAVTFCKATQRVRLVAHRVFQPSPDEPLDFEATIEAFVLDLAKRFAVRKVLFDPYQMQSTSQRLARAGIRIEEFPQSNANLTLASQNLYDLIEGRNLALYPDQAMRLAVSRCVAIETARGWRITKEKQSHKIDVIVALGMAAWAAVANSRDLSTKILLVGVENRAGTPGRFSPRSPADSENLRKMIVRTGNLDYAGQPIDRNAGPAVPFPPRNVIDTWLR
jgi:phage terminase large subunit-like protein